MIAYSEENITLDYPSGVRNRGYPLETQVHGALETNATVILWGVPELWGPVVYFSTLLSDQSSTFVASLYLKDGKILFSLFY